MIIVFSFFTLLVKDHCFINRLSVGCYECKSEVIYFKMYFHDMKHVAEMIVCNMSGYCRDECSLEEMNYLIWV